MRWFWSLYGVVGKPSKVHTNGHAPTLDEAKAQFAMAGVGEAGGNAVTSCLRCSSSRPNCTAAVASAVRSSDASTVPR